MPYIENQDYRPSFLFRNTDINTIYTALYRTVDTDDFVRERWELPDTDFIDIDFFNKNRWENQAKQRLVILLHGLEGNARRPYMKGMMRAFDTEGWHCMGINHRSCSGEDNRLLQSYNSGWTKDLDFAVEKMRQLFPTIIIVGFSAGGNIALRWTGDKGSRIAPEVKGVLAFSTPIDLEACSLAMQKQRNALYMRDFLVTLKKKAVIKNEKFPNQFDLDAVLKSKSFIDFDNTFTAPVFGYRDGKDYWHSASSLGVLSDIKVSTLIVNAADDTFLGVSCYPIDLAKKHHYLHFEMTKYGGHLGFYTQKTADSSLFWTEKKALAFVKEIIHNS